MTEPTASITSPSSVASAPGALSPDDPTVRALIDDGTITETVTEDEDESEEGSEDETEEEAEEAEAEDESETGEEPSSEESAAEDEELTGLTDEEVSDIIEALEGDDRFLDNERIKQVIETRAKAEADKRVADESQRLALSQQQETAIERGRAATDALLKLVSDGGEALTKAALGQEFDEVILDPTKVREQLRDFAIATHATVSRGYDHAFSSAFREGVRLMGREFTQDDFETVSKMAQTAERIRSDPNQGNDAANAYLFTESVKFLMEQAVASGQASAKADFDRRRSALKKITGENTTRAAVATVAKKRKKLAPTSTKATAAESDDRPTMDAYDAAIAAEDFDLADRIIQKMQTSGAGYPVPGR